MKCKICTKIRLLVIIAWFLLIIYLFGFNTAEANPFLVADSPIESDNVLQYRFIETKCDADATNDVEHLDTNVPMHFDLEQFPEGESCFMVAAINAFGASSEVPFTMLKKSPEVPQTLKLSPN